MIIIDEKSSIPDSMFDEKMKCPKCLNPLVEGKKEIYETLVDHVMDPNGDEGPLPMRSTFRCPKNCYGKKAFWDAMGDSYGYFKWYAPMLHKLNIWGYGYVRMPVAIDSDSEMFNKAQDEHRAKWREEQESQSHPIQ